MKRLKGQPRSQDQRNIDSPMVHDFVCAHTSAKLIGLVRVSHICHKSAIVFPIMIQSSSASYCVVFAFREDYENISPGHNGAILAGRPWYLHGKNTTPKLMKLQVVCAMVRTDFVLYTCYHALPCCLSMLLCYQKSFTRQRVMGYDDKAKQRHQTVSWAKFESI